MAYTDGSAKGVRGWLSAGYGVWYGDSKGDNYYNQVPAHERQSVSRGELNGVLHDLQPRGSCGLGIFYKGIVEWSVNWRCHGWCCSSGEVGHRDLSDISSGCRRRGGSMCRCAGRCISMYVGMTEWMIWL